MLPYNPKITRKNNNNNNELEALRAQEARKKEVILRCINSIKLLNMPQQINDAIAQDSENSLAIRRTTINYELEIARAQLESVKDQSLLIIKESTINFDINRYMRQINLIKEKAFEKIARLKIDRFNLRERTKDNLEKRDAQEIQALQENLKIYTKLYTQYKADLQAEYNTTVINADKIKLQIAAMQAKIILSIDKISVNKLLTRKLDQTDLTAKYHLVAQTLERLIAFLQTQKKLASSAETEMRLLTDRLRLLIAYQDFELEKIICDFEKNTVSADLVATVATDKITEIMEYANARIRATNALEETAENKLRDAAERSLNDYKVIILSDIHRLFEFNPEKLTSQLKTQLSVLNELQHIDSEHHSNVTLEAKLNSIATEIEKRKESIADKIKQLDRKINASTCANLYQKYLMVKAKQRETINDLSQQLNLLCDIENQYACRHPALSASSNEKAIENPATVTSFNKKPPCIETFFYLINLYKAQVDLYQFQQIEIERLKIKSLYDQVATHLDLPTFNATSSERSLEDELKEIHITNDNIKMLLNDLQTQDTHIVKFLWAYYYAFIPQKQNGELVFNLKEINDTDLKARKKKAKLNELQSGFPLMDYLQIQFTSVAAARSYLRSLIKSLDSKKKIISKAAAEKLLSELNYALNTGSISALECTREFLYSYFAKVRKVLTKSDEINLSHNIKQVALIVKKIGNDRHVHQAIDKLLNGDIAQEDFKAILTYVTSTQYTAKFEIADDIIRHALINTEAESFAKRKLTLLNQARALINNNSLSTAEEFKLEKYKLLLVHLPALDQLNIFAILKQFSALEADIQSLITLNKSNCYKRHLVEILSVITAHQNTKQLSNTINKIQTRLIKFLEQYKQTVVSEELYANITGYIVKHLQSRLQVKQFFGFGRCVATAELHKRILAMVTEQST